MTKIIDEVREITAAAVAKGNDAAKLNFPKLIEKIKGEFTREVIKYEASGGVRVTDSGSRGRVDSLIEC